MPSATNPAVSTALIQNDSTAQVVSAGANVMELRVGTALGAGNITVDGGGLMVTLDLRVNDGSNGVSTMTVQNGGSVTSPSTTIGYSSAHTSNAVISGAGTHFDATSDFTVGRSGAGTASLNVQSGGWLESGTSTIGSLAGSTGVATVSGAQSKWTSDAAFKVGDQGNATLTIQNQGTVFVGTQLAIGSHGIVNLSGGTLRLDTASGLNGLNFTSGTFQLAHNRISNDSVITTVFGGPSPVIPKNKTLAVEGNLTVSNTLTIQSQGSAYVGDLATIASGGIVNLSGGTLRMNQYAKDPAGTFNYFAGTIQLAGDRNIGTDAIITNFYGGSPMVPANKGLTVEGTATLLTPFTLNGGTFAFNDIDNSGFLNFQQGTLRMTGSSLLIGGGDFGPIVELAANQNMIADNSADISSNALLHLTSGASFTGSLINNAGEIHLDGSTARLGGLTLSNSGLLKGNGRVESAVTNLAAGEIRVDANERLVFTSSLLVNQGQVNVIGGTIDLRQGMTNQGAVNLTGGSAEVFGDLAVQNSGRVSIGGSTTATLFGDVVQNGIFNVGPGSKAVFFGDVSGSGTFPLAGSIEFLGSVSPGNSPGLMSFGGNVSLDNASRLDIEIAGATKGGQYDALVIGGAATIAGALDVSLLAGFMPQAGSSFEILSAAGGVIGTFSDTLLPTLSANLNWNLNYGLNSVVLSVVAASIPGDFNLNGVVDSADYVVWREGLGTTYTQNDYNVWRTHFGQTAGSGSGVIANAAVPEPAFIMMLMVGTVASCFYRLPNPFAHRT